MIMDRTFVYNQILNNRNSNYLKSSYIPDIFEMITIITNSSIDIEDKIISMEELSQIKRDDLLDIDKVKLAYLNFNHRDNYDDVEIGYDRCMKMIEDMIQVYKASIYDLTSKRYIFSVYDFDTAIDIYDSIYHQRYQPLIQSSDIDNIKDYIRLKSNGMYILIRDIFDPVLDRKDCIFYYVIKLDDKINVSYVDRDIDGFCISYPGLDSKMGDGISLSKDNPMPFGDKDKVEYYDITTGKKYNKYIRWLNECDNIYLLSDFDDDRSFDPGYNEDIQLQYYGIGYGIKSKLLPFDWIYKI